MKRIFIALKIEPGPEFTRISSSLRSVLAAERIAWTEPSNIHLTLFFLGDTEDELIKAISIMLKQNCTGFGDFRLCLKGVGVFRNFNDPRIIWIGVEHNENLLRLNNKIVTGLKYAGIRTGENKFNPHITLGRIKSLQDRGSVKRAIENYQAHLVQEINVEEVILYESILKPAGPVYRPEGKFSLQ